MFPTLIKGDDFVLDLGCGAGREAKPAAALCARVYALDLVKGMLRSAKSLMDADNVYLMCADARCLPVRSGTMDVVLMTKQFLNHITVLEKRSAMMREVYRVLKPGGRVFMTVHNNLFDMGILHVLSGIYKIIYGRFIIKRAAATPANQNSEGGMMSLPGMAVWVLLLKLRSIFINSYRRIASAIYRGYKGKEAGDWEISQVSNTVSPCKSPYHNFTVKEIESLVSGAGFHIQDIKDTWELSHGRQLPGFIREGAYTIAVVLKKVC